MGRPVQDTLPRGRSVPHPYDMQIHRAAGDAGDDTDVAAVAGGGDGDARGGSPLAHTVVEEDMRRGHRDTAHLAAGDNPNFHPRRSFKKGLDELLLLEKKIAFCFFVSCPLKRQQLFYRTIHHRLHQD